jgi:hypothetical protein
MTVAHSPSPSRLLPTLALAAAAAAGGFAAWQAWEVRALRDQATANAHHLERLVGEMTRLRLEESAGTKGPAGLLAKLKTYAPLLANSRVTEPDFQSARREMDAILRAFESLGTDAIKPVRERLAGLKPDQDYDEVRFLYEVLVRLDRAGGLNELEQVVLNRKPSPNRLRIHAAELVQRHDRPLAQRLLRQVMRTESHRGINPDRLSSQTPLPDTAALSNTGFFNFVVAYVRTEDPELDDTLLMVLGRAEHDLTTIQECVKALGDRRCAKAAEPIQKLYRNPPLNQQNPIFLNYCLEAVVAILGKEAVSFLETELPRAPTDLVAKRIQALLDRTRS